MLVCMLTPCAATGATRAHHNHPVSSAVPALPKCQHPPDPGPVAPAVKDSPPKPIYILYTLTFRKITTHHPTPSGEPPQYALGRAKGYIYQLSPACPPQAGWTLTVANVGDSLGVLDTGSETMLLTSDHRVANSKAEQDRVRTLGGNITNIDRSGNSPTCCSCN